MLLKEVGQEHADWYLIAKDGNLTAKVSAGLCIGEDEFGLLLLNPTPNQALIRFDVDQWGRLQIEPASAGFVLLSPQRNHCANYQLEPFQGLALWLPNNQFDLANNMLAATKQYDDLPVTLVPKPSAPSPKGTRGPASRGPAPREADDNLAVDLIDEALGTPVLDEILSEEPENLVQEAPIPVLDSPIERVPEPAASETLITQLPYGFEPKGFTTTHAVAVTVAESQHHQARRRSYRVTAVVGVILAGVAAGLLAAKLDLVEFQLPAAEPRTAFNPATPRLVLLSEAQIDTPDAPAISAALESPDSAVAITPPETTPATPASRPVATAPSGQATASVYRTDLADAEALFHEGFITAPGQRNSVAILQRILGEDPTHPEATSLLKRCADRMINAAVQADEHGLNFEARNLVEEVMAFYPAHEQAQNLWQRWTEPQEA